MGRSFLACLIGVLCLAIGGSASAIDFAVKDVLFPRDGSGAAIGPEGIAFDPGTGDLLLTAGIPSPTSLTRITTSGDFVSNDAFPIAPGFSEVLREVIGIGNASTTDHFLVVNRGGLVQEVTRTGAAVTAGISFMTPPSDEEGITFHPGRGTIFLTNDDSTQIEEFSTSGDLLNSFDTLALAAGIREPTGITVNPFNGNLLFSSDFGVGGGSEQIVEVTTAGFLVGITDLNSPGLLGAVLPFRDAEGLAVDRSTNTLYAAFQDDAAVVAFDLLAPPSGPSTSVARLVTGSPVSISQLVDTPSSAFSLQFDYLFKSVTGELSIFLDGILLDSILAPPTLSSDFMNHSILVDDATLLSQVSLEFVLDGIAGSEVLLDNILFPSLSNGSFEAGSLVSWQVDVSQGGSVGVSVLAISATVPEPSSLALLSMALGVVTITSVSARRRRTRTTV